MVILATQRGTGHLALPTVDNWQNEQGAAGHIVSCVTPSCGSVAHSPFNTNH